MIQKLLVLLSLFGFLNIHAQDNTDNDYHYAKKGDHTLNIGVGFPNTANILVTFANITSQKATSSPDVTFRYEYGITDKIGLGLHGGYFQAKTGDIPFSLGNILEPDLDCCLNDPLSSCCLGGIINQEGSSSYKINSYSIGGRLAYHFYKIEKLDTYSGIIAGYNFINFKEEGDTNTDFRQVNAPTFIYYAMIGARYYFSEKFAAYGEFGNSMISPIYVNMGLNLRL